MNREFIRVALTLLPPGEGGRQTPITKDAFGGNYRPHIVIGDPNQREPIIIEKDGFKNYIDEKYLGVAFWKGSEDKNLPINRSVSLVLILMYAPHEQYNELEAGVTFTLREGSKIIGFGNVEERWVENHA